MNKKIFWLVAVLALVLIGCQTPAQAAYPTVTQHHKVYPWTSVMASPYSCDNTGTNDCAAAIEQLKTNQSNAGTIYVPAGTFKIGTNLTIPSGMTLKVAQGGILSIQTGVTLTINGPIEAGDYQIFTLNGTGAVNLSGSPTEAKVVWYNSWSASEGVLLKLSWFSTLSDAITAIGSTKATLEIDSDVTVSADTTFAAGTLVKFIPGNVITVADTKTLTINGRIQAGVWQIFNAVGTGSVVFGGLVQEGYPEWWGENTTPGTTDMDDEIQAAVDSGLPKIIFQGYDYEVDNGGSSNPVIDISRSNLHLYGLPGAKISRTDCNGTIIGTYQKTLGSSLSLSADAAIGDSTVTLSAVTDLAEGDYILLGAEYEANTTASKLGSYHIIKDVTGLVVTLDRPLAFPFTTANSSFVQEVLGGFYKNIKIEGLTLEGKDQTDLTNRSLIFARDVDDIEIVNCNLNTHASAAIIFDPCINAAVRDCRFKDIYSSGLGYCVKADAGSHHVVVDNIFGESCGKLIDGAAGSRDYGWSTDVWLVNSSIIDCYRGPFSSHIALADLHVDNVYATLNASCGGTGLRGAYASINNVTWYSSNDYTANATINYYPLCGSEISGRLSITNSWFDQTLVVAETSDTDNEGISVAKSIEVKNNYFRNGGISLKWGTGGPTSSWGATVVEGNIIEDTNTTTPGDAIKMWNVNTGATTWTNIKISNNVVLNTTTYYAIRLDGSSTSGFDGVTIQNNQIFDCDTHCIYAQDTAADNVLITGNYIRTTTASRYAIYDNSSGSGWWVSDNYIEVASAGYEVSGLTTDELGPNYGYNQPLNGSIVWDPASLADGAGETSASITVTGAALGDFVIVSAPYDLEDCIATAYVQAANTVEIRLQNESTATRDLGSGTWKVRVIR